MVKVSNLPIILFLYFTQFSKKTNVDLFRLSKYYITENEPIENIVLHQYTRKFFYYKFDESITDINIRYHLFSYVFSTDPLRDATLILEI